LSRDAPITTRPISFSMTRRFAGTDTLSVLRPCAVVFAPALKSVADRSYSTTSAYIDVLDHLLVTSSALRLIARDEAERADFGQDVSHTFFRADATSHFAMIAGVMNFVRMSVSVSAFLSMNEGRLRAGSYWTEATEVRRMAGWLVWRSSDP